MTTALAALAGLLGGCQTAEVRPTGVAQASNNTLAELHTKLGIGYLQAGKLELAWNRLHRALEEDPSHSTAHSAMAVLQERLNDPNAAEVHYQRAVELEPSNSSAQTNYGSFLCRNGRYEEGERRFMQALKNSLYERPEVAWTNAGLCMKNAGDLDKAETYLRSGLEIEPRIPAALVSMAEISFEKKRFLPARGYLQRYLEVARHSPQTLWLGVRIERELGDKDAASSYAMMLRGGFPDSNETRKLLESGEP